MCRTAQVSQASRQPQASSIQAVSGQPMVLAKPAISVMPVMGPRAPRPNNTASVENATSYRPKAIAIPTTTQPAAMPQAPVASASNARPMANSTEEVSRSGRPPCASTSPETSSDHRRRRTGGNPPTGHCEFCIAAGFATNGRYRESSLGKNSF